MSRRITTRWYIGAWVVSLIVVIAMIVHARALGPQAGSSPPASMMLEFLRDGSGPARDHRDGRLSGLRS